MSSILKNKNGFTLIEIVAAIGIFSILLLIATGVFSQYVASQRRAINEQQLQEDVRLVLEQFNKEARTGYGTTFFSSDEDKSTVTFRNQNRVCVRYSLEDSRVTRAEAPAATESEEDCSSASYLRENIIPLNDPQVEFTYLQFTPVPAQVVTSPADNNQLILFSQGYIQIATRARGQGGSTDEMTISSTVTSRQTNPY